MRACFVLVHFQAQRTVTELQAQLDLLKDSTEAPAADTEDVAQLKVRQSVTCTNCNFSTVKMSIKISFSQMVLRSLNLFC